MSAWAPALAWLTLPGIVLALIGPFGSFGAPLFVRLLYWVPTMAAGGVIGFFSALVLLKLAPSLDSRRLIFALVHAVVVTALMVLVVWGWGAVVFGRDAQIALGWPLIFYVGVISLAISLIRIAMARPERAAAPVAPSVAPAASATTGAPPLARRLKPELRAAPILALEAEDHYVRVHTASGADLLLLRLSDAIAEMQGVDGVRTHRSWWVSRDAVAATRREDGRLALVLSSGLVAPVSRAAAAAVRAAVEGKG